MYAKNSNYVTFFKNNRKENTDKVVYGRISEAIKTGQKTDDNKNIYNFENWDARFVGKAYEKAKELEDKTPITITEWSIHNPYSKEHNRTYPYIMVMDFEVREVRSGDKQSENEMPEDEDGFMNIPDGIDEELPFQ